jgi:membrane protease YdiL (CAAX protease family)
MQQVSPSQIQKLLEHPFSRMLLATFCIIAPIALTFIVAEAAVPKALRVAWPQLLAALFCVLGYRFYVQRVERRLVSELAAAGATAELGLGLALGTGLCLLTLLPLLASGVYRIEGLNAWTAMLRSAPEMVLVSVFEEVLVRGILFRIAEKAWGSRKALLGSIAFFVLAHLPGGQINLLGIAATATAAVGFAASMMLTRRLWLPIGIHFAWNFLFDGVFSVPVSGHEAKGWIEVSIKGPVWLTGGAYGVEASAMTLLVWMLASAALMTLASKQGR